MAEFESLRRVEDERAVSDNNEDADGDKLDNDADKVEQLIECVRRRSILFELTSRQFLTNLTLFILMYALSFKHRCLSIKVLQ